jgi:hypothetical protein
MAPHTAGGRGEFNWDNVKADKDREFYLGHSVKALTGRWQKGEEAARVQLAAGGWKDSHNRSREANPL